MYQSGYLEGENCDTCNKLNGKVFDIKDAKVGVNLQPMHPNCDCMTGILDANGIIIALLSNKEKGKDGKNVLMELIAGKQFSFGQNPQLNLLNGNATNAGLSVLFDLPFVEWVGGRFAGVTNRENDAREHNTGDIIFGVLEAIDENNFGGAVQWVTEHFRGNAARNCESEYDYYLGRMIGNAISILVGAGTTASGVAQIIGSIAAGGAISIGSGGTLAAGGVSIIISGVAAGAATVAYGGTVVTVSAAKFGDDFDKMQAAAAAENRTSGNSSADTDSDKISQEAIEKGAGITKSGESKLKVIDGKVGGKVPVDDYNAIRKSSIKNSNSKSMTLGKYADDATSYTKRAGDTSYFDLGSDWSRVQNQYKLTDAEMFEYFNKPALSDAISSGKAIRFSHDPRALGGGFLRDEWEFLKSTLNLTDSNLIFEGGFWYVK